MPKNKMNSNNNIMYEKMESLGPQLFAIKGSFSIWTSIIQSFDQKLINTLIKMTEEMDSNQKYNLAKRILIDGFEKVLSQMIPNNNGINDNINNDNESQELETNEDIVNASEEEEEESLEYDVIMNSSDSYAEASAMVSECDTLSLTSNKSYATARESSQSQAQEISSKVKKLNSNTTDSCLSIITESDSHMNKTPQNSQQLYDNSRETCSQSQRSQVWSEESLMPSSSGLSGNIVSLSPITSFYSQKTQTLSPTTSLTLSSSHGFSPKSSSLSPRSHRKSSPPKSQQKIIEEYKSLVPYDSYCSEKVYINDNDCHDSSNDSNAIFSTNLLENIIEENVKSIELTDESIEI